MIVQRSYVRVKRGKVPEAIALLKEEAAKYSVTMRIYQPRIGVEFGRICYELEYEDLTALDKASAEWEASGSRADFMAKWMEMVEGAGRSEVWKLAD